MGAQVSLAGHHHATRARIRAQEVVVLGQDPTFLDDGTPYPKAGMGTVQRKARAAYRRHPTVAFTPERRHLGVRGLKVWPRQQARRPRTTPRPAPAPAPRCTAAPLRQHSRLHT
jgi:hypothetical protein